MAISGAGINQISPRTADRSGNDKASSDSSNDLDWINRGPRPENVAESGVLAAGSNG
jgi:hypothetical protein